LDGAIRIENLQFLCVIPVIMQTSFYEIKNISSSIRQNLKFCIEYSPAISVALKPLPRSTNSRTYNKSNLLFRVIRNITNICSNAVTRAGK